MSDPEVIFLSDVATGSPSRFSRYLGPYVLASRLEQEGVPTLVVDFFTDLEDPLKYIESFLSPSTKVVGLSSTFLTQASVSSVVKGRSGRSDVRKAINSSYLWFGEAEDLNQWLLSLKQIMNKRCPGAHLVLGGGRTPFILKYLNCYRPNPFRQFDYFYVGNSEKGLLDLLRGAPETKTVFDFEGCPLQVIHSQDDEGCPETIHSERTGLLWGEALPIEISRGCRFSCKFCYFEKRTSRVKDQKVLKTEMIRNYEHFGTQSYYFSDDCFNDSREKVESVCSTLSSLPFKVDFVTYARPDMSVKYPDTLEAMVEAGCAGIFWGIETFNWKAGLKAGKGMRPELIIEAFADWRRKYKEKCIFQGSFIVGLPGETPESQRQTIETVCESDFFDLVSIGPLNIIDFDPNQKNFDASLHLSEYSRNPEKYGLKKVSFDPMFWEHETMSFPEAETLSDEFIKQWYQRKWKSLLGSIWHYPPLRSLGFSKEDLIKISREPMEGWDLSIQIGQMRSAWQKKYWENLVLLNKKKESQWITL